MKIATQAQRGNYCGGKNGDGVCQRIINIIPPHKTFIEACAGSAAVTRMIKPAETTMLIETDSVQAELLRIEMRDRAVVFNGSFWDVEKVTELSTAGVVIFFDPPYLKESRTRQRDIYNVEWNYEDHAKFVHWVRSSVAKIIITHPRNLLYENALQGWNTIDYKYMSRKGLRYDCIWYNYPTPEKLHDYSYIGNSRTERQMIKRKRDRWVDKMAELPGRERNAIIAALQEKFM